MIDRETWARYSTLLDQALELAPAERARWLQQLQARDGEAATALAKMLSRLEPAAGSAAAASSFGDLLNRAFDDHPEVPAAEPGRNFGPWQVSRKLGSGGMGEVWMATRVDRLYEGQAAIKLLAGGGDTRRLDARFARERKLLARLTHPGIARLLDAGISEGQPYLVLEYVDGQLLLDYARSHAPTVAARLRLALAIGRAVEHAHSRLIVHRDLKPSNVMVTAEGEVKLLDFGIGALMEDATEETTSLTRLYGRGLTLDYAAPEQITGEPTGVGCDVYSLGVMLYELLTGQRPIHGERPGRTALEHAVLHSDAPRLSRAIAAGLPAGTPAGARPQDVQRVHSDLEAVIAKALRKAPEDRYPTMASFIADLEHWLEHRPVSAGRGDWRYRSRLWLRRNRLTAGLTVAIIASLCIGLGISLWQWQRALQAAQKSKAVQGFLVSLFEAPNNWETKKVEPSLRNIVEGSAQRVERELAGQPDVQLTLNEVLLNTYQGLGDYPAAEAIARRSIELSERVHGRDSGQRAHFLNALANNIFDGGRYDEAAALYEEALRILRLRFGSASLEVADALNDLAAVEASRGRLQESVRLRREALQRFEHDKNADPDEVERIRGDLGVALDRAGAWREAESLHRLGLANLARERGSLRYSSYPHNLGSVLTRQGHYAEAETHLREAIEIRRRQAAGHPYLALSLRNYAQLLDETGRTTEAAAAITEALPILRDNYGADSATVATTELRQALIMAHAGDTATAEAAARSALRHIDATAPLDMARGHRILGEILLLAGSTEAARAEIGLASASFERLQGSSHPEAAMTLGLLGIAESRLDPANARAHLERAIATLSTQVDPAQATLLRIRQALAELTAAE